MQALHGPPTGIAAGNPETGTHPPAPSLASKRRGVRRWIIGFLWLCWILPQGSPQAIPLSPLLFLVVTCISIYYEHFIV